MSWADRLIPLLCARTGHQHVATKNAMGGVGLLFGVANYTPPAGRPRLMFIEFSTGDLNLGLTPPECLPILLTQLVLRARADGADVVIVHNWRGDFDVDDRAGIRASYDKVARELGVPVIANHAFAHARLESEPTLRETWFRDVCHTNPQGAESYARHVDSCLAAMSSLGEAAPSPDVLTKRPTAPVRFFDVSQAAATGVAMSSNYVYSNTGQRFDVLDLDDGVEFTASGQLMGVGFISGPRAGWVQLSIDGEVVRRFRCFDRHSHYERYILLPAVFVLQCSRVRLNVADEPVDFSIASKEHPDFVLRRTMKLVHLAGQELTIEC